MMMRMGNRDVNTARQMMEQLITFAPHNARSWQVRANRQKENQTEEIEMDREKWAEKKKRKSETVHGCDDEDGKSRRHHSPTSDGTTHSFRPASQLFMAGQ